MNAIPLKSWLTGLAMVIAAILATVLTPTEMAADVNPPLNLKTMIPKRFGDWQQVQDLDIISNTNDTNPNDKNALAEKLYTQTLARTYVNARGEQIMLTIAYGKDQRNGMQVHKPEACYPAQGFKITQHSTGVLDLAAKTRIPVIRMVAVQPARIEPITYWTTVGDQIAVDSLKWKFARFKYGLTGKVPDGLLFRVSSIDSDSTHAFAAQAAFIRTLISALDASARTRILGQHSAMTSS